MFPKDWTETELSQVAKGASKRMNDKDYSPKPDNNVTTHTTGWGLEVGAELGKDPHVGVTASFNKQVTWNISDMQVFNHTF